MNAEDAGALPYAHGGPVLRGRLRAQPEDFFVDEDLGFEPDGDGEHAFVRVEKRGANTEWVARQLAQHAGVAALAVGFAGMKDRHAVTRQTFSVHLPGRPDPDWAALANAEFRVLDARRHRRKLQRGALRANRFRIVLRDVAGERDVLAARVAAIRAHGVPNYFGEQRFGRDAANVARAAAMFGGRRVQRHERSMLLSAARSHLFNVVLAERVRDGTWAAARDGDVFMLAGSQSVFGPEPPDDALRERLARGDISPTGPLWGAGELRSGSEVAELENAVAAAHGALAAGLVANGLRQERRALMLRPSDLACDWSSASDVELSFGLSKGAYATVVIREIMDGVDAT